MEAKRVRDSSSVMTQVMTLQDTNPAGDITGNVNGGVIMRLIDLAGAVVAVRHVRHNVVTASVDRLDFHNPVFIGNLVTLKGSLNYIGRTSMEVGVRVESEDLMTGVVRHTASAYLTYVALDRNGKPVPVPPLLPETDEEIRRNREAHTRRENRLREKEQE